MSNNQTLADAVQHEIGRLDASNKEPIDLAALAREIGANLMRAQAKPAPKLTAEQRLATQQRAGGELSAAVERQLAALGLQPKQRP
jgi:hypothetical protein